MKCQDLGGERSDAYRAVYQALPHALKQICDLLRVSGEDNMSKIGIADESLVDSSTKALPQESCIQRANSAFSI